MAAANGILTPPQRPADPFSPSSPKRKHADVSVSSNGVSHEAPVNSADVSHSDVQSVLSDILTVLKGYDTQPSILNLPISSSVLRSSSGEPSAKRTKLQVPNEPTTIANLLQNGQYNSLESLVHDVGLASSEILASLKTSEADAFTALQTELPSTLDETRTLTGVLAFKKIVKTLVSRAQQSMEKARVSGETSDQAAPTPVSWSPSTSSADNIPESRTVLTLYGTAQGPKQLFSSLQQPSHVPSSSSNPDSGLDTTIKVSLPLRESTLPNIISTTEIFPLPTDGKKKREPTLGEVFGPQPTSTQLSPPKPAKQLTTRGSVVTFVPQDSLPKGNRRIPYSYTTQSLSTGQWLGYGGVDLPKDPTSPTAKHKSRQRALSTGEAQLPPSEATLAAVQQAKEDALFRSAYSSFAPSRDDATAIIPEETKNQVWWQKVGEDRFNNVFGIDPILLDLDKHSLDVDSGASLAEESELKEAVENYVPPEKDDLVICPAEDDLQKSTDDVLEQISELLETLASQQRNRNSSLATNPRTPVIQNASLASLAGSPSTPSADEIDIHEMLKNQLSLLISSLPPYAVAKLNGDQLAELNLDKTILIGTKDYRGVLEEDQVSRHSKAAVLGAATASTIPRIGPNAVPAHSHYAPAANTYARSASSGHPSGPRPSQTSQSYFPQQHAVRSPSVHSYQRPMSGAAQSYQASASYVNTAPRPSFPVTPAYNQHTPRAASYAQPTPGGQYYSTRPSQPGPFGAASSQYYQSTPQPAAHSRYTQQPQNGYQQRPQNLAYSYGSSQSPHMRTGSPLKAAQPLPQPNYHAPRLPYAGTPVAGGQVRSGGGFYTQPSMPAASQYGNAQLATPSTVGPAGFHTSMSSEQQQIMLDRQRQQLAVQPQARMAAQGSFNRQGSGTPQPPNPQYGGQPGVNGATMIV